MLPDTRRAIRTCVHTIGALSMLVMLAWIIHKATGPQLTIIAGGLITILILRELFHGVENVAARIKFGANKDGITAEIERALDLKGFEQ